MTLETAQLIWRDGVPESARFGDIYFSRNDALGEVAHNFLGGNDLPARLAAGEGGVFTIGETGFGTGLNFLCLWQMWDALPTPKPNVHFITTELHPLTAQDLARAHKAWPVLENYARDLQAAYPPPLGGAHRRFFAGGRVVVDFLWGDAATQLARYDGLGAGGVQAWFLDGFAPRCNAAMWSADLFAAVAARSAAGASCASFTSAGAVRRGLEAVGFCVEKKSGFGKKRNMCVGVLQNEKGAPPIVKNKKAVVVGGGLAGVLNAAHLARLGWQVVLLEAQNDICLGASGNPASAFVPFYHDQRKQRARMLGAGHAGMVHWLAALAANGHELGGNQDGMVMLNMGAKLARTQRFAEWQESLRLPDAVRRRLSAEEASALAGVALPYGGWFYPQAGWLDLAAVACAVLAEAGERVTVLADHAVAELVEMAGGWQARVQNGAAFDADIVVLAAPALAAEILPEVKLEAVHGQSICFAAPPALHGLKRAVGCGYNLLPLGDGRTHWGASFRHKIKTPDILAEETTRLVADFKTAFDFLPQEVLAACFAPQNVTAWAGLRYSHASRLPLIGAVAKRKGLYVSLAHGARGSLTANLPFSAAAYDGFTESAQ